MINCLSVALEQEPVAAFAGRRAMARTLRALRMSEDLVEDVLLVTSELITNAVEHGAGPTRLELDQGGDRLVVRVQDGGGGVPVLRAPVPKEAHGRGLLLVNALASDWGCVEQDQGKYVWAEFSLSG